MLNTFAKVMKEFAEAFVSDKRTDGKTFYKLKDGVKDNGVPDWLSGDVGSKVMREIHEALDDRLPNDWVYEAVSSLADAFVDYGCEDEDSARESLHEIADGLVDVYNSDRLQWLADHMNNALVVDEACEELCADAKMDTFSRIGLGQYHAYDRLGNAVISAIKTEADGRDDEPEVFVCEECGKANRHHHSCSKYDASKVGQVLSE